MPITNLLEPIPLIINFSTTNGLPRIELFNSFNLSFNLKRYFTTRPIHGVTVRLRPCYQCDETEIRHQQQPEIARATAAKSDRLDNSARFAASYKEHAIPSANPKAKARNG